jgi:phosphotransferase system enzyme I (PtsI)
VNDRLLRGVGVSPGVAIGRAVVVQSALPDVPHRVVPRSQVAKEVRRLRAAVRDVQRHVQDLKSRTATRVGPDEARIFDAQLLMLEDADFLGAIEDLIRENHLTAEKAFEFKVLEQRDVWMSVGNARLKDRIADLNGVMVRVVRHLLHLQDDDLETFTQPTVVVTREIAPGLTIQLDRTQVVGLASEEGTRTSHAAILAHSMGMPAVMGIAGALGRIETGTMLLLDGSRGTVLLDPTPEEIAAGQARVARGQLRDVELERGVSLPAITKDGLRIALRGNVDLPEEIETARELGAEGVGLLRTEFLVTGHTSLPTEDDQARYFARVGKAFAGHPVVIRSYDLGGDKFPAAFQAPYEANPFLGWRAIRVCLDQPELFRVQIRAVLRAAADADLQLMIPLVTRLSEVERTREMVVEEGARLAHQGVRAAASVPVGVMVETPAAAVLADRFAEVSDFLSVGTNDLTQYTLVVDRGNARLADRFTPHDPSVLRLLKQVADAARAAGKPASVCGEMASDPLSAFLLLGLGYETLSVAPPALPLVRWLVRQVTRRAAQAGAQAALDARRETDVLEALRSAIAQCIDPAQLDPEALLPVTGRRASLKT